MRCVCLLQSVAARVKCSKVWAHVTKLSDTSVRCNIYSSVIVNIGGNTSNIMKYLLTKHNLPQALAVFTSAFVLPRQRLTHLNCIPKRSVISPAVENKTITVTAGSDRHGMERL